MGRPTTNDPYIHRAHSLINGSSPEYHISRVIRLNDQLETKNIALKERIAMLINNITERSNENAALKKMVAELADLIYSAIQYERKIKALLMKIDADKYVSEIATLEYACQKMESALDSGESEDE